MGRVACNDKGSSDNGRSKDLKTLACTPYIFDKRLLRIAPWCLSAIARTVCAGEPQWERWGEACNDLYPSLLPVL